MSKPVTKENDKTECNSGKKPGLIGRLVEKLDNSLKQKANEKSQQSCCGGSNDGKGGKCC